MSVIYKVVRYIRLALPGGKPSFCDGVHQILAVAGEDNPAGLPQGLEPLNGGGELHPVVGGVPFPAGKLLSGFAIEQDSSPASRSGIARAGAVGVKINGLALFQVKRPP